MRDKESDDIHSFCRKCSRIAAKMHSAIAKLKAKQVESDTKIKCMSDRVDLAETTIKKNMEEIKKIETSVDDDIEVKMDNIQQEILERKKKKKECDNFWY